jgi:hypothetical protein
LADRLASEAFPAPDSEVVNRDNQRLVQSLIDGARPSLTVDELTVLRLRFGFVDGSEKTHAEIAYATTQLGITPVIEGGVIAGFRPSTEAGRIAANALARRAPVSTSQTALELGGGAGLSMFSGNPLAALAALYRAAARHSPPQTAILTNELGKLLGSPLTSGAAAGAAAQADPLRQQLEEELRRRSGR